MKNKNDKLSNLLLSEALILTQICVPGVMISGNVSESDVDVGNDAKVLNSVLNSIFW